MEYIGKIIDSRTEIRLRRKIIPLFKGIYEYIDQWIYHKKTKE